MKEIIEDTPIADIEEAVPSNPDSTGQPELTFSACMPQVLTVDMELEFRSMPISSEYMKKLIRQTKAQSEDNKNGTGKQQEGPWLLKIIGLIVRNTRCKCLLKKK